MTEQPSAPARCTLCGAKERHWPACDPETVKALGAPKCPMKGLPRPAPVTRDADTGVLANLAPDIKRDLPPGPYSYQTITPKGRPEGGGHVYLVDANGRKIGCVWGVASEKLAIARLLCHARDLLP